MGVPDGVLIRSLDLGDPADLAAAIEVRRAYETGIVGGCDVTADAMRSTLTGPDAWPGEHRLALRGGEAVGLLVAEMDQLGREIFIDAYALGLDATRIQRVLLEGAVRAAVELAAADRGVGAPGDPFVLSPDLWQVVSGCYEEDAEYAHVLESLGFRTIRRFWRMRLDVASRSSVEPAPPLRVTRRVVAGERDRRVMHALFVESFAEHFGSTHDHPFEEWIARVEAVDGVDPSRWWIATADGQDVGICLLDDSRAESGDSYVRTLGVVASARGRGIARWLLECAAADAVARGRTGLALAVDGESTTGATALYASVGFTVQRAIDVWCRPILPTDEA